MGSSVRVRKGEIKIKVSCKDCGIHFEEDFNKALKCSFWQQRNLDDIPKTIKKEIWDWVFSLPIDSISIRTKKSISVDWYGHEYEGNEFEKDIEGYKDWTDKERKKFQRDYFKFIYSAPQDLTAKLVLKFFLENIWSEKKSKNKN